MYADLLLPCTGRQIISKRPLHQIKQFKTSLKRKYNSGGVMLKQMKNRTSTTTNYTITEAKKKAANDNSNRRIG